MSGPSEDDGLVAAWIANANARRHMNALGAAMNQHLARFDEDVRQDAIAKALPNLGRWKKWVEANIPDPTRRSLGPWLRTTARNHGHDAAPFKQADLVKVVVRELGDTDASTLTRILYTNYQERFGTLLARLEEVRGSGCVTAAGVQAVLDWIWARVFHHVSTSEPLEEGGAATLGDTLVADRADPDREIDARWLTERWATEQHALGREVDAGERELADIGTQLRARPDRDAARALRARRADLEVRLQAAEARRVELEKVRFALHCILHHGLDLTHIVDHEERPAAPDDPSGWVSFEPERARFARESKLHNSVWNTRTGDANRNALSALLARHLAAAGIVPSVGASGHRGRAHAGGPPGVRIRLF